MLHLIKERTTGAFNLHVFAALTHFSEDPDLFLNPLLTKFYFQRFEVKANPMFM